MALPYAGMSGNKRWSNDELHLLEEHYPAISARELTLLLNGRSDEAIKRHANRMGFRKCPERLEEMGRENARRAAFKTPPPIEG